MVKPADQVIEEFNEYVNMTASELEKWLEGDESSQAGWSKSGGGHYDKDAEGEGSESVGQESGRKIVEILKKNPKKDPSKYDDDDIDHMRRVAAYCKRHLAGESKAKEDPHSKSAISLKNWGHDPQKA